ncbi:sigma 54-interacting transcriptional regulator [Brunnivagina elsteri]|uniref:RNA polymerase subunit sigma-54 n=1 Tax=Brunnivagina elsteri CCALA 953 TaxID=987040 RepID=A0A2A2TEK9_9CYAN|nr:sigma 54-interacting transcriptional regulator [Calothrix elsteri]PAX52086.1 RNA polymerase subunit sigma-54 [Calothrix elsteri CCALA 953]
MKTSQVQLLPLQPVINGELQSNEQAVLECADWLSFHRVWGQLRQEVINAIAQSLQTIKVEADTEIYRQDLQPVGLYLLKWGSVEIYRQSRITKTHITYRNAGDVFGYVPLVEQQANATYRAGAIALSKSEIWFLGRDNFLQLQRNYPEIQGVINNFLAQDLTNFAQRIAKEQARIQGLQSYIHPVPMDESIIGESKASQKLQQQVQQAAVDLKPVILQASQGSGKTFIAGFIHAHSGLHNRPFAEIDLAQLPRDEAGLINTDSIFGKADQPGIIELLERGTLLVDNVQLLQKKERERLIDYLKTGKLQTNVENSPPLSSWVRLILASPSKISLNDVEAHQIKLFPLPQRKQDIPDFAAYFLNKFCRESRRTLLELNQAGIRRLISYDYPANLVELESILKRAVVMTPPEESVIPEQVLWSVESKKNAFRVDLLNQIPWLRRFLLSKWWPERFWIMMMAIFIPVTIMGYLGPQTRDASVTLNFFWAWWWPFYLLLFPIAGRLWCAVCPFMITGEWLRKISLWIYPRKLLPWPTKWLNKWGAWLLWAGFVAIYLWEKLWDLPHTPYLSASLLLIITGGAVIGSIIYERRLWCRYLCPIGGMNGMFAKLSMVELRSTQQVCGSQCSTFPCYKGSIDPSPVNFADALPTEGQATDGCPLYSHPAQLKDNRDCVLCMTCLKACPNRSVQINLRFPGTDLLENHQGFWAEAALMLLLFGGVFMHYSHRILGWFSFDNIPLNSEHLLTAIPVVTILLTIPFVSTYFTHKIARIIDQEMPDYLTVIYAYLPMTLAANLAYYIPSAITEAGKIIPVIARTIGYSGAGLLTLTWSMDVANFLQGVTLLSILIFSIYPLVKITKRPFLSNLPHILLMFGFIVVFFQLMF